MDSSEVSTKIANGEPAFVGRVRMDGEGNDMHVFFFFVGCEVFLLNEFDMFCGCFQTSLMCLFGVFLNEFGVFCYLKPRVFLLFIASSYLFMIYCWNGKDQKSWVDHHEYR